MITGKNVAISREDNKLVRKLLDAEASAYKNHIVSAIERELVKELKDVQALFHVFVPDSQWDRK